MIGVVVIAVKWLDGQAKHEARQATGTPTPTQFTTGTSSIPATGHVIRGVTESLQLKQHATPVPLRLQMVHHALSWVGVHEQPAGSNTGPHIDGWQALFHIHGEPWCGAFAGAMIHAVGHQVDPGVVYTPNIRTFAVQGTGGFKRWIPREHADQARGGDLVLYDFPDSTTGIQHVGILRERPKNGRILTVEGNTSTGTGSQDNGGCVAARDRPLDASVVGFARWYS